MNVLVWLFDQSSFSFQHVNLWVLVVLKVKQLKVIKFVSLSQISLSFLVIFLNCHFIILGISEYFCSWNWRLVVQLTSQSYWNDSFEQLSTLLNLCHRVTSYNIEKLYNAIAWIKECIFSIAKPFLCEPSIIVKLSSTFSTTNLDSIAHCYRTTSLKLSLWTITVCFLVTIEFSCLVSRTLDF